MDWSKINLQGDDANGFDSTAMPSTANTSLLVEVPDEAAEEVRAELEAQGVGVWVIDEEREDSIRTIADLIKANEAGRLEPIAVNAFGPDQPPLIALVRLKVGVGIDSVVSRLRMNYLAVYQKLLKAMMALGKEGEEPTDETSEMRAQLAQQIQDETAAFAGRLFDAGMVVGWDEATMGMEFTRDNFIRFFFVGGAGGRMIERFAQLNAVRVKILGDEGKGSSPASNGAPESVS